jgi:hypothetical protein
MRMLEQIGGKREVGIQWRGIASLFGGQRHQVETVQLVRIRKVIRCQEYAYTWLRTVRSVSEGY